jgi:hypothetical protein
LRLPVIGLPRRSGVIWCCTLTAQPHWDPVSVAEERISSRVVATQGGDSTFVTTRVLRIQFGGAVYHVTPRCDRREVVFEDDEGRECFFGVLAKLVARYK